MGIVLDRQLPQWEIDKLIKEMNKKKEATKENNR